MHTCWRAFEARVCDGMYMNVYVHFGACVCVCILGDVCVYMCVGGMWPVYSPSSLYAGHIRGCGMCGSSTELGVGGGGRDW